MIDNKPPKPKTQQKQSLTEVSVRDTFQTPNYATDLLVPFLNRIRCPGMATVWECAAGLGKISKRLNYWNYRTLSTDLAYEGGNKLNFLTGIMSFPFDAIVTNPPFSLKASFYKRCLEYQEPFALLIPADYAKWVIDAVEKDGCEKIIPSRRIDYITPNILRRIWEGEAWEGWGVTTCTLKEWKETHTVYELQRMLDTAMEFKFDSIYEVPAELLKKYSSSLNPRGLPENGW